MKKIDMILKINRDTSYLSESKARSRPGGYFYMGGETDNNDINGASLINSTIMKNAMYSAQEFESGALYDNAKFFVVICNILEEIKLHQPAAPLLTENSMEEGIINKTIRKKFSRSMDMRFYWVQDREQKYQLHVICKLGTQNLGNYFTKTLPALK